MTTMTKGVIMVVAGVCIIGGIVISRQSIGGNASVDKAEVKGESIEKLPVAEMRKTVSVQKEYQNPAGIDRVGFSLVVDKDDVIIDTAVDILASHETSVERQSAFSKELPEALKGKKLTDLEFIDTVGGSALTTNAFNDSLEDLKSQL